MPNIRTRNGQNFDHLKPEELRHKKQKSLSPPDVSNNFQMYVTIISGFDNRGPLVTYNTASSKGVAPILLLRQKNIV